MKRGGGFVVAAVLASLAAGELGLRAWYRRVEASTERWPILYERTYWAVPPWVRAASILVPDPVLGAWMRPNARRTYINLFGPLPDLEAVDRLFTGLRPALPEWARARPSWTLETNSLGLRGPEVPPRRPGVYRVAAVGDSWTVGVNASAAQAYPAVLERLLAARGRPVEVLNFGRIGAAGVRAVETLRTRVRPHAPDLVVLAFGQNDEPRLQGAASPGPGRLRRVLERSELLRLAIYAVERRRTSVRAALESSAGNPWALPVNAVEPCRAAGAAAGEFARALEAAVAEARSWGSDAVLLYAAMPDGRHCAREALRAVSARTGAPLADGAALLGAEIARREAAAARGLALGRAPGRSAAPDRAALLLRARRGAATGGVLRARLAAARGGWAWEDFGPLRDDGRGGDERAGDGVFTTLVELPAGQDAAWLLRDGPPEKGWSGVENYFARRWRLAPEDAGRVVAPPVAEFGRRTLRSDPFHADAEGYALLAEALARTIAARPSFARGGRR